MEVGRSRLLAILEVSMNRLITFFAFVAFVCCGAAWLFAPPSFLTACWGVTALCNGIVVAIRLIANDKAHFSEVSGSERRIK